MNIEESIQQINELIEAWELNEACLNQTDIDAIKCLLKQNKELKQKYLNAVADYETTMAEKEQLKKQLEEWENHLKCSKEMLDIQGQKGNYDYDEYMLGLYNGMEYIIALFETREPNYISGKDVKFTNNKTQQKEFINYLKNMLDDENDIFSVVRVKDVLQKYKSIIGGLNDK